MTLGPVGHVLRPLVADLDERWEAWCAERDADPAAFAAHLHAEGVVDAVTLDAALSAEPLDEDTAETYFGTHWEGSTEIEVAPQGRFLPGVAADLPGRGWELGAAVGAGAMGTVLRARDRDLNREVAYKVMSAEIAVRPDLAARFYCEAQITGQLDHPNVPPIYALARTGDGRLAYTMKLVDGVNLEEAVRAAVEQHEAGTASEDAFSRQRFLDVFLKVCDAVHYAHHHGVLHRDLKPENVMVGAHGEVYVMDWGIAGLMVDPTLPAPEVEGYDERETLGTGSRPSTHVVGTPGFMSPEQAQGASDLDGRSDQYALGLILQELLTLRPAVTGLGPVQKIARNQLADRDPIAHRFGGVLPAELVAIVGKATQERPDDRYEDVGALAEDVRRYLRGEAVIARPDSPWMAVLRWVGHHRQAVAVLVLLLVSAGVVTTSGMQVQRSRERAAAQAHEQQLAAAVANAAHQAAAIDRRLQRYEGLLEGLSAAAVEVLRAQGDPELAVYWASDFDDPDTAPPDLRFAPYYGAPVSVDHPALLGPRDTTEPARLVRLHGALRRTALRSSGEELVGAAARARIAEHGVPLPWVSVALESGLLITYPGHGGFPDGYDPRGRPWYRLGARGPGPTWGAPYVDSGGLGLLLPCSAPLLDGQWLLGVASVKLPFDQLIGDFLDLEDARAAIVDGEGRVVVQRGDLGRHAGSSALQNAPLKRPLYPVPQVVEAIRQGQTGWHHLAGEEVVLGNRLGALGWYYVVQGAPAALGVRL